MPFPNSPQANGWPTPQPAHTRPRTTPPVARRDADVISPPRQRRQRHALALLAAVSALGAVAVMNLIDDPRPLDVQLSTALGNARQTLTVWQHQLSRGLQVSMLAVADGRELADDDTEALAPAPPAAASSPAPVSAAAVQ